MAATGRSSGSSGAFAKRVPVSARIPATVSAQAAQWRRCAAEQRTLELGQLPVQLERGPCLSPLAPARSKTPVIASFDGSRANG